MLFCFFNHVCLCIFCLLDLFVTPQGNFRYYFIHVKPIFLDSYMFMIFVFSWYWYVTSLIVTFDVFTFEFYFVLILKNWRYSHIALQKSYTLFTSLDLYCMRLLVSPYSLKWQILGLCILAVCFYWLLGNWTWCIVLALLILVLLTAYHILTTVSLIGLLQIVSWLQ